MEYINSEHSLIYINSALQSGIANQVAREFHKNHRRSNQEITGISIS